MCWQSVSITNGDDLLQHLVVLSALPDLHRLQAYNAIHIAKQ